MEYGFLIAIIWMFLIACSNIITKKLSLEFDWLLSTFFYILSTTFFACIFFLILGEYNFVFNLQNNLLLALSWIAGFSAIYFLIKSFWFLSVWIVLTIFNSYYLWNYFYDILLWSKSFGIIFFLVLLLFLYGLFNIFKIQIKEKSLKKEFLLPFLASFFLFIFTRINSIFINDWINSYSTTLMTEWAILFITLLVLVYKKKDIISTALSLKPNQWLIIWWAWLFNYLGVLLLNRSYKYLEVFTVNIINSSQVLVLLILSYFIFKEKLKFQQIFWILCVILSLLLIYYFNKI